MHAAHWVAILALVAACDCEPGDPPGDGALRDGGSGDGAACPATRSCLSGRLCCDEGDECVDDRYCLVICDEVRCGDNGSICCEAGEICLDGVVCAASCAAGETVCGADLSICCPAGDACVDDACVTPGDTCADDYDCLTEGDYCELTIGRCLAIPDVMPACELLPDFDDIELEVEWHWDGTMAGGLRYQEVAATPAVGDVSGDGIPDVVVPVYRTGSDAILVALSGNDGTLLWSIGPGADDPDWIAPPTVGNLDPSDDALEIVYALQGGGIRVVDGDGVTELGRRTTGGANATRSAPSLADLNGDGTPDVVVGCHAMNGLDVSSAAMDFFDFGVCTAPAQTFATSVVADLDLDGLPEITSGGAAYQIGATAAEQTLWTRTGAPHGLPAVADLDVDGAPEVVVVRSGTAIVIDGATGAMRIGPGGSWVDTTLSIPGGGEGGAPTVADFDGDGRPEFATAGRGQYVVYDPDCTPTPPRTGGTCASGATNVILWQAPTQDISSSVTGSSVFDFQGDGVAEVIYNDECFFHVYDGRDGREVLMTPRPSSSRTALEYPLVVDVDRDGNSEIVVPSNSDQIARDGCLAAWRTALGVTTLPPEFASGTNGIHVFGDPGDRWVRTRPIWNQFAYHVTNVDDRGGIPMTERDNWSEAGLNNYRQNVQGAGVFNAPNLTVTLEAVARCAEGAIRLSAVVRNSGSRGVPAGVLIELVQTVPAPGMVVGSAMTSRPLLPGETERVTVVVTGIPYDIALTYEVRVDGASAASPVAECNEDDNTAQATETCPGFG